MKFLKVFLAALLAVVVGGVVSSLLWIFVFHRSCRLGGEHHRC